MLPYIAEFIGTSLLILLGCGVCCCVNLEKSGFKGGGTMQITIGWAFAVMIPAFIFGAASGAHFNPALTIALAVIGKFQWALVPGYCAAQIIGALLGATLVWILYMKHFEQTDNKALKLGVFCTAPSIKNTGLNLLSEIIGTFVLVFAILGISQVPDIAGGMTPVFVWAIIGSIGMSLGGLTGYAINPARDFGPRLAHAILPIKGKGDSNWSYAWIPIVGPIIGAILAAELFVVIPW